MTERLAVLRYHRTRQRAGRSAALQQALTRVTLDIGAAGTADELARAAAAGAAALFAAQVDMVLEMPDGQVRGTSASPRDPEPRQRDAPREVIGQVIERVLGTGRVSAATRVSREDWLHLAPDSPLRSDVCLAAARPKPRQAAVAIAVDRDGMPSEEIQVLGQLVLSAALAAEVLRSQAREHLIAMTLRRTLLPAALPEVPGLAMSFRYVPAGGRAEVGGDLYEALLWEEKVLVAIGDVQGHSLGAA